MDGMVFSEISAECAVYTEKMCFQNPFSLIFLLFWHKINVFAVYVEKVSCEIPFF